MQGKGVTQLIQAFGLPNCDGNCHVGFLEDEHYYWEDRGINDMLRTRMGIHRVHVYIYIHTSWASWQNQNGSIDGAVRRCLLSFAEMCICTSQVGFHHQQCGKSPSMGNNFRMLQAIPSPSVGTQFLTMFKIQDVFNTYALPFGNVTMLWTSMDKLPIHGWFTC